MPNFSISLVWSLWKLQQTLVYQDSPQENNDQPYYNMLSQRKEWTKF